MNRERIEAMLCEPLVALEIERLIRKAVDEALEAAAVAIEARYALGDARSAARIVRSHKSEARGV